MQHPRHLRPPMNYTTRPHRDRPIYRQPRPFALASAFGFATAPVFHAAAAAPSTTSLSLSHNRSLFCFNFRSSRIGRVCFELQFLIHIACCGLP
jgi:hypothetical protein